MICPNISPEQAEQLATLLKQPCDIEGKRRRLNEMIRKAREAGTAPKPEQESKDFQ